MSRSISISCLVLLAACTSRSSQKDSASPTPPAAPPSVPDMADVRHAPNAPAAPASTTQGSRFAPDAAWVVETPSSPMRKAQYLLPRAAGDGDDASLVVFHFGTGAGTREANLERWTSQFEQPDGRPSSEVVKTSTRTLGGEETFDVDLSGTYVAETAPGSGLRVRKEGWRMLATILDDPQGPLYVKLVGPQATVAHWETSYRKFVDQAGALNAERSRAVTSRARRPRR